MGKRHVLSIVYCCIVLYVRFILENYEKNEKVSLNILIFKGNFVIKISLETAFSFESHPSN